MAIINQQIHGKEGYYFFDIVKWHSASDMEVGCSWFDGPPKIWFTNNAKHFNDGRDYYYLEFKEANAFSKAGLEGYLSDIIDQIRDPDHNLHLIVSNSHEAFLNCVDPIYKYIVNGLKIPAHKIVLITGAFDIEKEIERVSKTYNLPPIKAMLTLDFEDNVLTTFSVLTEEGGFVQPNTLEDKTYTKKFLNLNRRWRLHRPTFVALLKHTHLINQGYVSLAPSDDGGSGDWEGAWATIITMHQQFPWIVSAVWDMKEELINTPPMYLDTTDLVTNRAMIEAGNSINQFYENTYFSLISETNYYTVHPGYERSQFLSEKAFKGIAYKHPFMLLSTPGTMNCLTKIGYQTFDGIIDETYDSIENDGDRFKEILNETQRLCNLTPEELTDWLGKAREICDYNYNTLVNKKVFQHKLNYE